MPKNKLKGTLPEDAQNLTDAIENPTDCTETEVIVDANATDGTPDSDGYRSAEENKSEDEAADQKIKGIEDDASYESDGPGAYQYDDGDEDYNVTVVPENRAVKALKVLALGALVVGVAVFVISKLTSCDDCDE